MFAFDQMSMWTYGLNWYSLRESVKVGTFDPTSPDAASADYDGAKTVLEE